jgi:predicted flavoprotein YhiN
MSPNKNRLVVIGGGAAGLFCAVNAARLDPSLSVIVVEKTGKLLSKVKVSGGGRCNVTHACYQISEMVKKYPRGGNFVRKAFHRFFTTDTIAWFEDRGVPLKAEADGRVFPETDSSQTVIDCLLREAGKYGVEIRMHAEVREVRAGAGGDRAVGARGAGAGDEGGTDGGNAGTGRFRVEFADSRVLEADYVCIACGGYPKSSMSAWIERLGHSLEPPVPSLFTFNMPGNPVTQLMGVSVPETLVKIAGTGLSEKGPLLITHWGLSGPVILRLSAWGARELAQGNPPAIQPGYQFTAVVNWIPSFNENTLRVRMQEYRQEQAAQKLFSQSSFGLPRRLWEHLLTLSGIGAGLRWADLPAATQNKLIRNLCAMEYPIRGKTTFKEEFVTAGGVRLAEVDPQTMQSRKLAGLFFAGEILDVDGITGGFNFQHAWTSGWIAASAITAETNASPL